MLSRAWPIICSRSRVHIHAPCIAVISYPYKQRVAGSVGQLRSSSLTAVRRCGATLSVPAFAGRSGGNTMETLPELAPDNTQHPLVTPRPAEQSEADRSLLALAEELDRQRTIREAGLTFATGMMGAGMVLLSLLRECHSTLPVGNRLGGPSGEVAFVECYAGRLYFQKGVKPDLTASAVFGGTVVVRETGDARGRGAYATCRIPKDAVLTVYGGDILSNFEYYLRYPDGVSDYCMALDADRVIDAVAVSQGSEFTAGHVNHSRLRHNVRRWYSRRQGRIWYLASRDIEAGEELLIDYGRTFWKGREKLEME